MDALRTPDDRFAGLRDFDFEPHYVEVPSSDGANPLRVHYLDEGPPEAAETVLTMHGEPSWCYLYRHMVPVLTGAGHRVIAPDLVGFGRSDKPTSRTDYTYARHVEWMRQALFEQLGLTDLTLVCQDWGGLIGLRLVAEHPDRFQRVVVANTGMPTGDARTTDAFFAWQTFSQEVAEMPIGAIVNMGTTSDLSPEVIAAYDAPFPDERYKEGARQFPMLVPTSGEDPASAANRRGWDVLRTFTKPFLCAFSDSDPITKGGDAIFLREVPGAQGQAHRAIEGGGHFLQEDRGPQLAAVVNDFIAANPAPGG